MKEHGRVCRATFCVSDLVVLCLVFVSILLHKPHGDSGQLVGAMCPPAPRSERGRLRPSETTERAKASEGDERGVEAPERVPSIKIGNEVPDRFPLLSSSIH